MVSALIRPHPLSSLEARVVPFPEGASLADMARLFFPDPGTHRYVVALVGEVRVPCERWSYVRPKAGALVTLGLSCFQGGGDAKSKSVLSMVAMVAIAVFAPQAAVAMGAQAGTWQAAAIAAGITMVGALAVNAIFKPPALDVGDKGTNPADSSTYSITGQANQATPYGPMLRVYGTNRIFPRLAAVPFTVSEGPNLFLYMLLDCGYGPLDVEALQIGDTAILNYRDVLYRVHPKWRAGDALEFYRNDTSYENFSVTLEQGVPHFRTSAPDTTGLVLDFVLPSGLVEFDDRGVRLEAEVDFDVLLRPAGSGGAWQNVRAFPAYTSNPSSAFINIGAVLTGPEFGRGFPFLGMNRFRLTTTNVAIGDKLYFASRQVMDIVNVEPSGTAGVLVVTTSPGINQIEPAFFVQSPILRSTGELLAIRDKTAQPLPFSLTVDVPLGQWEVQVVRTNPDSTSDRITDTLVYTSLRSVSDRPPVAVQDEHTIIELKIRANEQLSGVLQNVNCIATARLPVYEGAVPPPGVVHFDFLTGSFQPVYGAELATATIARVNSIATRVNELGLLVTVPADSPRFDYDPATLAPRGLLVEQGVQNILLSSQDLRSVADGNTVAAWSNFVDADTHVANVVGVVTSPGGGTTVSKLCCTTAISAQRQASQSRTTTDNTIYCVSVYARAAEVLHLSLTATTKTPQFPTAFFNLQTGVLVSTTPAGGEALVAAGIINAGGGWFRCWIAFDSKTGASGTSGINFQLKSAAGGNYVGAANDGLYLWGAMMEPGSAPTSYIQTFTGAVGRNNDLAAINALGAFFNASEGTIVSEWLVPHDRAASVFPGSAVFTDGTDNNRLGNFVRTVDDSAHLFAIAGGVSQADVSLGAYAYGTVARQAFAYKANRFAASYNGGAVGVDASGTVPLVNRLLMGRTGDGHNWLNGWLRRVTYYPFAVTDSQLVAMSGASAALAPGMWVEQPTRNPAWAYADVLTGSGAIRPLPLARLDVDRLRTWANYCDALVPNGVGGQPEARVRFDHVVDYSTTTLKLLQSIASAGRATPSVRDGRHGVIVDSEQTLPVQMFTPRNSWGFHARRVYLTEPDALRVKFVDPENNWQEGDVVIYAAGKDATTSTTFEDLKLFGVTRYTQATRDGRYLKAQALLRREEFEINVDVENLVAERGDLVLVQHDVLEVGGDSSRVLAVSGARLTVEPFGTLPAASYGVRLRLSDGTITAPIPATLEAPDVLILSAVPTPAPLPGDLLVWGYLSTESGEYLVKSVAPGSDLTATLTLAEIARAVYNADAGEIPAYLPPAGGRPTPGPGPMVANLRVEQVDKTVAREPYCDLVLSWDIPSLGGYPSYRVARVRDDGVQEQVASTFLTRVQVATALRLLDPDVLSTPLSFSVIGVDAIGRQSEPAFIDYTPRDPRLVPGDVLYLTSNAHDKTTTLTWFAPTDPAIPGNAQVLYYEVRWSPVGTPAVWGTASRVTELVPWNVTTVTVPSRNGAYLVKAITASRVESALPGITVIATEDLVIQDIFRSRRFAPGWTGTLDNVVVDGSGRLTLAVQPDGTYPAVGVFYADEHEIFSELLQCRVSAVTDAGAINNTFFMADWTPLSLAAPLAGVRMGFDWNVSVWINAEADPFVMADWIPLSVAAPLDPLSAISAAGWRPLLHGEYIAKNLRFAVVLESFRPNVTPLVAQAGVDIDFPERSEEHSDIIVPDTGLDFTFSRPFVFPPSVAIDLQDATVGDYVDRGPVDAVGFPLFVRSSTGAAIEGVVDVSAFGVGRVI